MPRKNMNPHESTQGLLKDGQESSSNFLNFFSVRNYAKAELKLFVAMPNTKLPTNFQIIIFIFEARARLRVLL